MGYKINTLLTFMIILSLTSCHKYLAYTFSLKNNSNLNLYYSASGLYPDTSVASINYAVLIKPMQTQTIALNESSNGSISPSGIIEFFLFDSTVLAKNPWDSVTVKYLVLKRYDLTKDSIMKMDGVISYP